MHPHLHIHTHTQWANHDQSLRLEETTKRRIQDRIEEKVTAGCGTWIDWQYLIDAVSLLRKVRGGLFCTIIINLFRKVCVCGGGTILHRVVIITCCSNPCSWFIPPSQPYIGLPQT